MKESVLSFEEKTTQRWFTYSQIAVRTKTLLWLTQLNIIFDDFGIW